MISGHSTPTPNDRNFGGIEQARRRTTSLFVPDEWCNLVTCARRVNSYQVQNMSREDFVSTAELTGMEVKKNTDGEKVKWLSIHWIRVERSCPCSFKFRYTHNSLEPRKEVDLRPKRTGQPSDMGRVTLGPLYHSPRPINPATLRDLKVFCARSLLSIIAFTTLYRQPIMQMSNTHICVQENSLKPD